MQYIVDRDMGHDPMPQYYASINMDMKTEEYIKNNKQQVGEIGDFYIYE